MVACTYGISLLVFNSTSHSFAALTCELSSETLEEKFHSNTPIYYSLFYFTRVRCTQSLSFHMKKFALFLSYENPTNCIFHLILMKKYIILNKGQALS